MYEANIEDRVLNRPTSALVVGRKEKNDQIVKTQLQTAAESSRSQIPNLRYESHTHTQKPRH